MHFAGRKTLLLQRYRDGRATGAGTGCAQNAPWSDEAQRDDRAQLAQGVVRRTASL
jgi:hypothetical protein